MKTTGNSAILLSTLSLALLVAACGGGGGTISSNPAPPPSSSGPYSAATLNGTYAFTMGGQDSGGSFARVGSFAANGAGGVTGGVEDVNSGTVGSAILPFSSSTYTMQANGKGTLTLTNQTGTTQYSIVMTSSTGGLINQTDGNATASGNFTLQTVADFTLANITNNYVFDFSGQDANGLPESLVGQFTANGAGGGSGVADVNDDAVPSGAVAMSSISFAMDTTYGSTFGRGIATIAGLPYAFYIVDGTRIRFLETDFPAMTTGDAVAQTGTIPTAASGLTGSFAFILSGSSVSGSDIRGGRFSLSGGQVSSIAIDDNNSSNSGSGNSNPLPIPDGSISAATYTIDGTLPGSGRGTLTFTDSKAGVFSFVFYLSSPTQAVFQDISSGIVADGSLMAQTGSPYTASTEAGNWGFSLSGVSVNGTNGGFGEEDFVGQYTLSSSGSVTGSVDFTEISAGSVVTNGAMTGALGIQSDGTGRNSYKIILSTSPQTTLNFSAYFVNPNTMFVIGTDTHRVTAGTVLRNF